MMKTLVEEMQSSRLSLFEIEKPSSKSVSLIWRVYPPPTGKYRSFEHRTWPSATYKSGLPAVQLICDENYSPRVARQDGLSIKIGLADWSNPSNKQTGSRFTWRYLVQRASNLNQAKMMAIKFLQNHQEFHPKPTVTENIEDHSVETGIKNGIRKAQKLGNATMLYYYLEASHKDLMALSSYEVFINSWAGQLWFKRLHEKIEEMAELENTRFNGFKSRKKWFVDKPKTF